MIDASPGDLLQLNDSPPGGYSHCFGSVPYSQLVEDVDDVGLDGALTDKELVRDTLVGRALGYELEHLHLSLGEDFFRNGAAGELTEAVQQPAGYAGLN